MSGFLGAVIYEEAAAIDPGPGNYMPVDAQGYGHGGAFQTTFVNAGDRIFFQVPYFVSTKYSGVISNPFGGAVGVRLGAGDCRTNNIIVAASGGNPPYSYHWTVDPESNVRIIFPNSNNTNFSKFIDAPSGETWQATCTVIDGTGQVAYYIFPISFNAVIPDNESLP